MTFNRERDQYGNTARNIRVSRWQGPYEDYGWERGESVLPEFRDPSVHLTREERESMHRRERQRLQTHWKQPGPYTGVSPRGYRRSDERIFEDICEQLKQHGRINARNIEVDIKDGNVTLKGTINDRLGKYLAEDVVERIHGVKDIQNQIHIQRQQPDQDSGMPGGGRGRVDRVGGSGVYPSSGPLPRRNAEVHPMASWGQGERGAAGYEDSGESELHIPRERKQRRHP